MKYGIPYMGSKRAIAGKLISFMKERHPNATHFYDLFGGGGAMSFAALEAGLNVHYNELNTAIVELLKKIQTDGVTPEFYEWVSREQFHKLKTGNDWKAGVIQTCWSFGNRGDDYLYSEKNEALKYPIHMLIVHPCEEHLSIVNNLFDGCIPEDVLHLQTINERRSLVTKILKKRVDHFQLQHLGAVNRLEHLEQLNRLPKGYVPFTITNESYENVNITSSPEETIVYCDIPYADTRKYILGAFNQHAYAEWATSSKYHVYTSSYNIDMPCVYQLDKRCTFSSTNNSKKTVEKLFYNKRH